MVATAVMGALAVGEVDGVVDGVEAVEAFGLLMVQVLFFVLPQR